MRGCPDAVGPGTDTDQRQGVALDLAKDPVRQPEVENPTAVQTVRDTTVQASPELDKELVTNAGTVPRGCDLLLIYVHEKELFGESVHHPGSQSHWFLAVHTSGDSYRPEGNSEGESQI